MFHTSHRYQAESQFFFASSYQQIAVDMKQYLLNESKFGVVLEGKNVQLTKAIKH